jgi:hypothetical protein
MTCQGAAEEMQHGEKHEDTKRDHQEHVQAGRGPRRHGGPDYV